MSDTDKEKEISPQADSQALEADVQAASAEQAAPEPQVESPRAAAPRPQVALPQDKAPMNPYLAGVLLGLTLLASYLILGAGLGASGALARLGAVLEHAVLPARAEASAYFGPWFPNPLSYYLVFMLAGTFVGGLVSAASGGRLRLMIERGPTASRARRLALALIGGVIAGFASRLAQGCTSGQGLSGGAVLLTGSFLFMGCLFATGYLTAWIFRRQWT
ncbi:YeeE/YedE thiosulfate transporter family protein [Fundidesulfovibrio soli]|uniref:YeeE/YedE thiosulfate transporter family protein n=1 Tax=Fundidesulfovibrio soli TaxID=2922716 RepID=UPI001FAEED39|nr:YeeE/YedE thiosulfate transporter family protein [Fundidesulfovibrio soli]